MLTAQVAIPIPEPLPLPSPTWLLWLFLMVTFFLHLLAMNFVLGGSIIGLIARIRGKEGDAGRLTAWISKIMPVAVAATITFGVAPLLFLQTLYGRLFFSSAVLMAWFWFAVVPLLIGAYYGTYAIAFRGEHLGRWLVPAAAAVAGVFAVIAFLYSNNMSMMLRPQRFLALFMEDARGLQLNLSDPTLLPRFLHMVFGAVAVAGLMVALYGLASTRRDETHGQWAMRHGSAWFAASTVLGMFAGMWWLLALPREVVHWMGASLPAALALTLGIIAGVAALVLMMLASRADNPAPFVRDASWLTLITLAAMVLSRDHVREGMLRIAGFQPAVWIEPQWGVIAIFTVLLLAGFGTVVWMAAQLRPRKHAG